MSKAKLGGTSAAVVLSCVFLSAQTISAASPQVAAAQSNQGRTPDTPLRNAEAAKSSQMATISGCVVRDAGSGGHPTISSNGIAYRLMGRSDRDLQRYLGKRLEVTGTLDSGARATSGRTDDITGAPKGQTATGGQSDVTATGAARDNTVPDTQDAAAPKDAIPLATDKGTTADFTARLQVKTMKMVAPNCLQ